MFHAIPYIFHKYGTSILVSIYGTIFSIIEYPYRVPLTIIIIIELKNRESPIDLW
jgi:hypothetical protein